MNENYLLVLNTENTRQQFIRVVNEAIQNGVPCFVIESLLNDFAAQMHIGAKEELALAQKQEMLMNKEKDNESDTMLFNQ